MPSPGDGSRLSIIPAGVFRDLTLRPRDIQVLGVLCCSTDGNGLTYRSQVKMARQLGVVRYTIQKAISNLVAAGWLKILRGERPDGGDCSHTYKVINKDQVDCEEPDLMESGPIGEHVVARREKEKAKNRQGVPPKLDTYKNESLITKDEEEQTAASRSYCESTEDTQPPCEDVEGIGQRFIVPLRAFLRKIGLDPTAGRLRGGLEPAWGWAVNGCDLELDVKPTLHMVLGAAPDPVRSLNYFTRAVLAAKNSRLEQGQLNPKFIPDGRKAAQARARKCAADERATNAAIDRVFGG
ncbi:helix-turn-helix domain-containing protein [Pseudovibrio brasiliensis]|uniref:Helix-turn-helix domain-containing protein n=1 Tax=Pseudovibrio brasiliensis TaxID=1898042 RepID=A0ABX8ALF9_9HYPH|nr:helix-turn-helix domain-containing protein [Pseudovibrio brasiliensis]QUS54486.1 helix-turn-helix domain-containing protein [Pseudovibrio brasiliensis]